MVKQAEAPYARLLADWNARGRNGRARAPQMRRDDERCAAGLSPRAPLFVARSLAQDKNSSDLAKRHLSITSLVKG